MEAVRSVEKPMGITSYERPFRVGYVNPRLNAPIDTGYHGDYLGFLAPYDEPEFYGGAYYGRGKGTSRVHQRL